LARDLKIELPQHADYTGQIDRVPHHPMGDDIVARPRGAVAEHDDFAVQEFDTGRCAGSRRPQAEFMPNRPVIEHRGVDFAKGECRSERRGPA
jgi:hypothetical protein